jgi:hypothetical protein
MKIASGNSQSFYWNIARNTSGYFFITDSARDGAICIWQRYKDGKGQWSGHAGIVIEKIHRRGAEDAKFITIEGNTNDAGGSEGYIVARKVRKYNTTAVNGLRVKGFVNLNIRKL